MLFTLFSAGNLGSACVFTTDCKVRNSKCDASQCVCSANFYDTNGDTTDGGLCRDSEYCDDEKLVRTTKLHE